jgi:hypothetical protein
MKWFLIAYTASGLRVAVSPPQKYSFVPHDKEWCDARSDIEASINESMYPEKDYAFVCERHKKRPKLTGKVDRDLQTSLDYECRGYGKACEMLENDVKHGLPLGTTSAWFWKARGG